MHATKYSILCAMVLLKTYRPGCGLLAAHMGRCMPCWNGTNEVNEPLCALRYHANGGQVRHSWGEAKKQVNGLVGAPHERNWMFASVGWLPLPKLVGSHRPNRTVGSWRAPANRPLRRRAPSATTVAPKRRAILQPSIGCRDWTQLLCLFS